MKDSSEPAIEHFDVQDGQKEPAFNRLAEAQQMSPEELEDMEKRIKRKLDIRLLSCVWLIFVLNYLDRTNIGAAKVAGITKSLDISSTQYSTAVAILFVGYILMQVPSNMFLTQLAPSYYLPAVMATWGMLSALCGAVHSSGSLYALRFLLGFVEAAFYPGALFLISSWYTRQELGYRSAILFSGSQVGSAFSGLIAAGIESGLNGARGLESWRWIFIIEGSITVLIALLSSLMLPDYPSNTRWLSPKERAVAEWRLIRDAGQVDEDEGGWSYGFRAAFSDWRLYMFAFIFLCIQVASATSNFFPSVVQTLGYNYVDTLLLTVPPYIFSVIVTVANNYSADRMRNSSFHIMWPLAAATVGFVVAAASTVTGARYFAMFLMVAGGHGSNAVTVAWTQKTMLRPRAKRAAAVAFVNAFGNISQVFSSYLYPDEAQPRYVMAMSVNSAFCIVAIILTFCMRTVLLRANKRIASGQTSVSHEMKGHSKAEISGLTDNQRESYREEFRYIA